MIINGQALLEAAPIKDMLSTKERYMGVSHGLAEAGYDIRIKQAVNFYYHQELGEWRVAINGVDTTRLEGRFTIASAVEEFQMPSNLVGLVKDKSTWARQGLSVFNTVIEPGWKGFLTLELVYHGQNNLIIPAGAGIAQVIFQSTANEAAYNGKYQNQEDRPVASVFEATPEAGT